ncbi:MAG: LamG-like jellyroll fold domain-containing protein [Planctomycetota bacterium]
MKTTQTSSAIPGVRSRGSERRRGVALIIAVMVLAALFLMAVPFAVFMRMQHGAGTQGVQMARARHGEAGALGQARLALAQGHFASEQARPIFPYDNPHVDTPFEFRVTLRTLLEDELEDASDDRVVQVANALGFPNDGDDETVDGYIRVEDEWMGFSDVALHDPEDPGSLFPGGALLVREQHRGLFGTEADAHPEDSIVSFFPADELWHLDIQDEQSKININTGSEHLLQNIVRYALDDAGLPTGDAETIGTDIYDDRRAGTGEYRPYRSVSEIKSRAGVTEEQFQALEPYLTISSALLPGQRLWQPVGALLTDTADPVLGGLGLHLSAGAAARVPPDALLRIRRWNGTDWDTYYREAAGKSAGGLRLHSPLTDTSDSLDLQWDSQRAPNYRPPGLLKLGTEWIFYSEVETRTDTGPTDDPAAVTVLRLENLSRPDPQNHPPGTAVEGDVILLDSSLPTNISVEDDYQIHVLATHAVNINTVTSEVVLRALLDGLESDLFDGVDIDAETAGALLRWDGMEELGEMDVDDFFADLDEVIEEASLTNEQEWLLRQSLNPSVPGGWQTAWTAPVRFNSGDISRIASVGVVDDRAGTPVAQSPAQRKRAVVRAYYTPLLSGEPITYWVRSQQEFHHALAGGGSSHVISTELNTDLPQSMLAQEDDWADIEPGIGAVAPEPLRLSVTDYTTALLGLNALRLPDYHLDLTFARGDREGQTEADVDNLRNLGLTDEGFTFFTDFDRSLPVWRNIQADPVHATIQPFAIECWVRYRAVAGRQYVFDMGGDDGPDTDRVSLYFEGGRLHFAIGDQTGEGSAVITSTDTFEDDTWYHISVAATGTYEGEMAMFIDGVYDEDATAAVAAPARYLLPVSRSVPAAQYSVDVGPGPEDEWPAGTGGVRLTDVDDLPERGVITINHSAAGEVVAYVYTQVNPATGDLTIPEGLDYDADPGDEAAHALPVARTGPRGVGPSPSEGHELSLWGHTNLTEVDPEVDAWGEPEAVATGLTLEDVKPGEEIVSTLEAAGASEETEFWQHVDCLVLHPADYAGGLAEETDLDPSQRRWKLGNEEDGHSGSLPCDPGEEFAVGAANDGSGEFRGLIDQFRITSLATAMVPEDGWNVGVPDPGDPPPPPVSLTEWAWRTDLDPEDNPRLMPKAEEDALPSHPLIAMLQVMGSEAEELPRVGYLLVDGEEQPYHDYEDGDISVSGVDMDGFRRVLPLSWIAATRLEQDFPTADGDIVVEDTTLFPADGGYVEIGDEIVGYKRRETGVSPNLLAREENAEGVSAYPRGAYGTDVAAGGHAENDIVRHVPVRFPDRYRVEFDGTWADWAEHADYSEHQLGSQAAMFSFSVPAANSQVRTVKLRFKEPLEDDQRLVVLINLDPANQRWGANPATFWADPEEVEGEDARRVELQKLDDSLLWGYVCDPGQLNGAEEIWIEPRDQNRDVPRVTGSTVEVRVYFDLSETDWRAAILLELDALGVEIVPGATSF